MKRILITMMAAMVALFVASPAMAQATRTWVSGVGDDANPCSRTAPCKTFAGAISKTAAGGEINCLDPGGFGGVTIVKAITLKCDGVLGGVLVSGTNGIIINTTTDANAKVVLDGLDIEGVGTGLNGVNVILARDVLIRNSLIHDFLGSPGNGILVNGTSQISVTVEHSTIFNNVTGVKVQSSSGNGAARVYDSMVAGNSTAGISLTVAGNKAEISGNQIIRSPKGLDIGAGTTVSSYGDNVLTTGDAPTVVPKG